MRDFSSCFGESGVQIADTSSGTAAAAVKTPQNSVTCLYRPSQSQPWCRNHTISVTWSRSLMGQGFSIGLEEPLRYCLCKVEIKPWLFSKRSGSKSSEVDGSKVDVFWDLTSATFSGAGPEPSDGFYVAVVIDGEMALLLGDMSKSAYQKTGADPLGSNAVSVVRKEHIYGKKVFAVKARFSNAGRYHDIAIEYDTVGLKGPCLEMYIDRKPVIQVKRLRWKFRGNETVLVEGLPVEVFWDVHSWLFGSTATSAVFTFRTCGNSKEDAVPPAQPSWPHSQGVQGLGFTLMLHAWKIE